MYSTVRLAAVFGTLHLNGHSGEHFHQKDSVA